MQHEEQDSITCHHCGSQHVQEYSFSFSLGWLIFEAPNSYKAAPCADTMTKNAHRIVPTNNHWSCSHSHALELAQKCINEHTPQEYFEYHATKPWYQNGAIPSCSICHKDISQKAYVLHVCYATPGKGAGAFGLPFFAWTCSEQHAREQARKDLNALVQMYESQLQGV